MKKIGTKKVSDYKGRYIFNIDGKERDVYLDEGNNNLFVKSKCSFCDHYERIYTRLEVDSFPTRCKK